MRRPLKLVALIALSLLTGCTSLQAVQPEQTLDKVNQLDVGSRLIVYEKSGRRIDMRFVRSPNPCRRLHFPTRDQL